MTEIGRFSLTKTQLFFVSLKNLYKNHPIQYAYPVFGIILLWITLSDIDDDKLILLVSIIFILIPVYNTLFLLYHVYNKENNIFYQNKILSFDEEYIYALLDDGSSDKIAFSNVVKSIFYKDYVVIYFSKLQFLLIPIQLFPTQNVLTNFKEKIIKHNNKEKLT